MREELETRERQVATGRSEEETARSRLRAELDRLRQRAEEEERKARQQQRAAAAAEAAGRAGASCAPLIGLNSHGVDQPCLPPFRACTCTPRAHPG